MNDLNKFLICLLGLFLSTLIQWIIGTAEVFNGIGLIFGIGIGWYARKASEEVKEELK